MKDHIKSSAFSLLTITRLALLPVRIRGGFAAGARWSLFPWTSYWRGTHEPALQAALANLGNGNIRGWNCWDLGAHFGLYSVGLARRVGATGQVAAFEPNPASFARLALHRKRNDLVCLKIYPAAVSDHNNGAELYTYGDRLGSAAHLPYEGEHGGMAASAVPVRTIRLDDLVAAGELRPPHFVKVDVEGHGARAFAGMQRTLAAARPLMVVAFHSLPEVEGVLAVLQPLGYSWRKIPPGETSERPLPACDYFFTPPAMAAS